MHKVYLLGLMPVCVGRQGLNFVSPHESGAEYIFTTMSEELQ
jgi:hypothetical protein